jgi:hypothetical protein
MTTLDEKKEFLEKDFYDALRWCFVGAVTWAATNGRPECALGMYTNFVQTRSLYEFFHTTGRKADDARVADFVSTWAEPSSPLYLKYMQYETPANKRVFHLVFGRSDAANAGGAGHDGQDHLKNQVLEFAKDLRRLTEEFIKCADPQFRGIIRTSLDDALTEAKKTAEHFGIPNPL